MDFASSAGGHGHSKEAVFLTRAASTSGVARSAQSILKPRHETLNASTSLMEASLTVRPPLVLRCLHPLPWRAMLRIFRCGTASDFSGGNRLQR